MPTSTVEDYVKTLYVEQQRTPDRLVALGKLASAMKVVPRNRHDHGPHPFPKPDWSDTNPGSESVLTEAGGKTSAARAQTSTGWSNCFS
ncbi:MAG: hypothetical protein KatS3mg104_1039 [Phycisphaerae bacterium]|nr:MAG: hypothetical protein KatS3mg104_1039 [Phycisphaerae bacterium]